MYNLVAWTILLILWVVIDSVAVSQKKLTFWVCWDFFFMGMTATRLYLTILEAM